MANRLTIALHDFGGYPYPAELSRALAARGHRVIHVYCSSLDTTPGGSFERRELDPSSLHFSSIALPKPLAKYNFVKRRQQERDYGRRAAALTRALQPDVVISANMPLDAQAPLQRTCLASQTPFIFWLQDVLGVATHRLLRRRLWLAGEVIGRYYMALEAKLLRASHAVVPITDDFRPVLQKWGIEDYRVTTIENWAPLHDLPAQPKDNPFSRELGITDHFVFLYAGTMGMKHNPELIAALAQHFLGRGDVRVVVLSQGPGADYLARAKNERRLSNLILHGYEPFERMPEVMASADVLVAVLEPDAGAFSVPSKVLAYLCAERALLLAIPPENLAGRIVDRENAGEVVAPDDIVGLLAAADKLVSDDALRASRARNGRAYAERAFDIDAIADRFEVILERAMSVNRAQ